MIRKRGANENAMSLFLTGGTGFFGRALLRCLVGADRCGTNPFANVTVLTRSPPGFLSRHLEFADLPWLSFHAGDMLAGMAGFPTGQAFSHVLHAAADSTLGPQLAPLDRHEQIVAGTRNALEFAVRARARRFLLTSSGGAYGAQPSDLERIPEGHHGMPDPMSAENAYGVSKRVAEHLCALYGHKHGIETVVARCFAFVGPDLPLNAHYAIGNFIRDALECPEIVVNGNGTPVRSYLYQDDLAEWLLTLLMKGEPSQAYNVGSDEAVTIAELAHLVRDCLAPAKPVRVMGLAGADAALRNRYVPDIGKARTQLGLTVGIPLREAIRLTARGLGKTANGRAADA